MITTFALVLYWSAGNYAAATMVPMASMEACSAAGKEMAKQFSMTTVECVDQTTGKVAVLK